MNTNLKLPKKIRVGYQERIDTYSGKLAFAISLDGRKEMPRSWEGWVNKDIGIDDYDNEPISGFVLNRDVGGTQRSYSWNARREKVRVYDPRGYEIEISVENLLLILQECSSIKGKGLEGDFVYSWSGNAVVLLPVDSQEYRDATKYVSLKKKKVSKKDIREGCIYRTKKDEKLMYMGRHYVYEYISPCHYSYGYDYGEKDLLETSEQYHVFKNLDPELEDSWSYQEFRNEKGFTFLAEKLTEDPSSEYADYLDEMMKQKQYSPIKGLSSKPLNKEQKENDRIVSKHFIKTSDNKICLCIFEAEVTRKDYFGTYSYSYRHHDYVKGFTETLEDAQKKCKLTSCYELKWNSDKKKFDTEVQYNLKSQGIENIYDAYQKDMVIEPLIVCENGEKYSL